MKEELIKLETAILAKEKRFGYNILNDQKIKSAAINNRNSRNYNFSYFKFSPDDNYLDQKANTQLIHTATNSSDFGLLQQEYNEGNHYGYKAYLAVSQSLLQKWLREVHNLHIELTWNNDLTHKYMFQIHSVNKFCEVDCKIEYNTYEEALEEGLFQALKLIKNENK